MPYYDIIRCNMFDHEIAPHMISARGWVATAPVFLSGPPFCRAPLALRFPQGPGPEGPKLRIGESRAESEDGALPTLLTPNTTGFALSPQSCGFQAEEAWRSPSKAPGPESQVSLLDASIRCLRDSPQRFWCVFGVHAATCQNSVGGIYPQAPGHTP